MVAEFGEITSEEFNSSLQVSGEGFYHSGLVILGVWTWSVLGFPDGFSLRGV